MRLALVIPALNEEEAIGDTLRRCLVSREKVIQETPVDDMVVVFVNDGSTDGTQSIVDQPEFDEVVKVRFEKNRGYGAAIKAGWQAVDADLVGFMDADGTCDPDFTVKLVNRLEETQADVVLAGRLNPESEMPLIRKVGNVIFARLLGLVSGQDLTDSASGFRIVRRSSLKLMSPLPDGLHFTPAMSCICLLDPRLGIEEVPMPYKERVGRSKLSVVKDGLRFLFIILFSACCYSPIKTLSGASAQVLVAAGLVSWLTSWLGGSLAVSAVLATTGVLLTMILMGTGVVVHQLNFLLIGPRRHVGSGEKLLQWLSDYKRLILGGGGLAAVAATGLVSWAFSNPPATGEDLVGALIMMTLVAAGGLAAVVGVVVRVVWAVGQKQKALLHDQYQVQPTAEAVQPGSADATEAGEGASTGVVSTT